MNKQPRKSRGQRASRTATWPGPSHRRRSPSDPRACAAPHRPSPSGSHRPRAPRLPPARPAPRAQEMQADATRGQVGLLPSPRCATPSMEVCSAGSWESGGTRREARGAGGRRALAKEGPASRTEAGLQGLPSRDLPCGLH